LADRLSILGMDESQVLRVFRTFNAGAEAFRRESERHDGARHDIERQHAEKHESQQHEEATP